MLGDYGLDLDKFIRFIATDNGKTKTVVGFFNDDVEEIALKVERQVY